MNRNWPRALALALIAAAGACGGDGELAPGGQLPTAPTSCTDRDGDGRGVGCKEPDCDDHDRSISSGCLRCAVPSEGCACSDGTTPLSCFLDATEAEEGMVMCHEGTRYCRRGVWSGCEGVHSYAVPKTVSETALIDPDADPVRCSDCEVNCFRISDNLDPVDGGLGDTNSDGVDWVPGGGLTLGRQDIDAGVIDTTDAGTSIPPSTCMPGTAPDIDCDGIPDEFDPYPNDPPFVTANPGIFLDIGPGQTGTGVVDLAFNLNAADIYFLVDQSASMTNERDNLKAGLTSGDFIADDGVRCADVNYNHLADDDGLKSQGIIGAIKCIIRDANFGVGFHREIPFRNYADSKHIAFDNYADITGDTAAVLAAVGRLDTIGNMDWPEASMLALNNVVTGSGMYFGTTLRGVPPRVDCPDSTWGYPCFRESAIPIVVLFTDAMMHNGPDDNAYPYNASYLTLSRGTTAAYIPIDDENEDFDDAYDAGNITDKLLTFTGDTMPMASDIVQSQLSCLSTDTGADAVVEFSLSQQRSVTVSTEGTRFDTVLGIFTGQPQAPQTLPDSDNTNETAASAEDLGTITGASVSITGNTGTMDADYDWSAVQCSAEPTSPDAMYEFEVTATTLVDITTDGSALDTVIALYSAAPALAPTYTASDNTNDALGSAQAMGGVYNTVRAFSGVTSALASNFSGAEVGCGADSASPDAVYSFTLAQPTRVRLSTEGSDFDTVIALVGDSCGTTPAMPPSSGGTGGVRAQSGNNYTFAAGSLIIPMGVADQDDAMLEAYGLVFELLRGDVPLSWVVKKNKLSDDPDFTLAAELHPAGTPVASHDYKAGPFVVDAADVPAAAPIIAAYVATNPAVVVHETTAELTTYVRRQLVAAPRFALMLDGGEAVARGYLASAAIEESTGDASWAAASPDTLTAAQIAGGAGSADGALFDAQGTAQFCGVLSTGWPVASGATAGGLAAIAEVQSLLTDAGSLIAQGTSVAAFENNGTFITKAGYTAGSQPSALSVANADHPLAQLDGAFAPSGGAYPSFTLPAADDYLDNDAVLLRDETTGNGENDIWVAARLDGTCSVLVDTCLPGQPRGMVSYLGGDDYDATMPVSTNDEANGVRLFLNAMLAAECTGDAERPVPTIQVAGTTATTSSAVTYEVTYTNDGTGPAHEAQVAYAVPAGATFVSASDGGTLSGSEVIWNLGAMEAGEEDTFSVDVTLGAYGSYANQASVRYAQGLTDRRVDSWIITTNYTSAPDLSCTALGINSQSVTSTNETQGTAHSVGNTNGRIFALSGSTSGMAPNYASTDLGTCAPDAASPDAAFKFTLNQNANVTIDTTGTSWDTVIGLYNGTVDPSTSFTATNTNETTSAPQVLGDVSGGRLTVSGGNTTSMVANYTATDVTCGATPNGSPDAVYSFTASTNTRVRVSTAGSSFDTVVSLHDGGIVQGNPAIDVTLPSNDNEGFYASPYVIPTPVMGNDQTFRGSTSSMRADVDIADSCYENKSWTENNNGVANTMRDAVFQFTVPQTGTYDIGTTGSSFNTVLAVYPTPPKMTDAPRVSITSNNSTLAGAYDLGTLDGTTAKVSGDSNPFDSSWNPPDDHCSDASNSSEDVFFRFHLDGTRNIKISTNGSDYDTVFFVYRDLASDVYVDCDDDTGWEDYSEKTLSSLPAGDYYIVVTGTSSYEDGYYQLTVEDTSDTNNHVACDDRTGTSDQAALTNVSLNMGTYYAVVKGRGSSSYGNYRLRITDTAYSGAGDNNQVACNDNYNSTQQSQFEYDVTAGNTYYVVVKGRSSTDMGTYALSIEDVNSPPVGSLLECNDNEGMLATSKITRSLSMGDHWVVLKGKTAGAAGSYNVRITDTAASVGTVLECNDDGGDDGASVIERDLTPGTYYVVVKGDGATDHGAYRLSARDVSNQGHSLIACDADSGAGTASHLQESLEPGTYYVAVKGDTATSGGEYDLKVQDANNNPIGAIACDDDSGTYKTSKITKTLSPGTYYAAVKGYDSSQEGRYQLTVGTAAATSSTYVPPTWAQTLAALTTRGVRVVPILSCQDDPDHGDLQGDCKKVRAQATTLASETDAFSVNIEPLVFDIKRDGTGLSRAVVDGIASLAEYLEMDVQVVVEFDPDANPGFVVSITAIDDPFDDCSGLIGREHQNCVPGATPRFNIAFTNPLPGVPLNPADPMGGYTFRAQLVADDRFIVEEIPIYIIPEQLDEPGPPEPPYNTEAAYWQDTTAPGCTGITEAPDWRDLSWDADVYRGTTITFSACASQDVAGLETCIPKEIASVTGTTACAVDADCDVGFCDADVGACQVATTGACTDDIECPANAFCDVASSGKCTYYSQPVYIGAVLAEMNFNAYFRMKVQMTGTPPIDDPPVLHRWEMTYTCQNTL